MDLVTIRPVLRWTVLVGDITTEQCHADLRRADKDGPGESAD